MPMLLKMFSLCHFHPMPAAAGIEPSFVDYSTVADQFWQNKNLPSRWEAVRTSANPFALESEPRSCPWRCGATRSQAWNKDQR